MGKICIIFDADGTLCDVEHRLHFLNQEYKDWKSFHDALVHDKPIESIRWLARKLSPSTYVIIVTARHEEYRELTVAWLEKYGIKYDALYMRTNDDRRPDHEVKADILQQIVSDGYDPIIAIDDRPSVVEMWRDWGITCLQCAPDEPKSKISGKNILTLLVGPSGAGKTTYAAKWYKPGEVISTDTIREQEGLGHTPDDLALTFKLARGYAKTRIDAGLHTVIDATNLKKKDRMAFVRLVPKDALITYVLINRDLDVKLADRGWRSEGLVLKHHKTFMNSTLADMKNADGFGNVMIVDHREKK